MKDETAKHYVDELKSQMMEESSESFSSYFTGKSGTERLVHTHREFENVASVRTACEGARQDGEILKGLRCSDHMAAAITAVYMQPAFRSLNRSNPKRFLYRQ